jgi:hypothetical protein
MSRIYIYYGSFASAAYFTDLFGVPAAAYSLRKLSPNAVYSGAAIRVRRSSDNTEQDINFLSSAVDSPLDTTALSTFVGANNGFVVTWYNQNGSANHFTQTTASLQPRIVNAGTIELLGGLPCVNILNVAFFNNNDLRGNARQDTYIVRSNSKTTYIKQSTGSAFGSEADYIAQNGNGSTTITLAYGTPTLYANKSLFTGTSRSDVYTHLNGHKIEVQQNGTTTAWANYLFGIYGGSAAFNYEGLVSEFIVWKADKSSQRNDINDNQNDYYNVF